MNKNVSLKSYVNYKDNNKHKKNSLLENNNFIIDSWSPNWVRLTSIGYHTTQAIDNHGHLYRSVSSTPNDYIDVPENLAYDVREGILDPARYSRDELEQMSIEKHMKDEQLASMITEIDSNEQISEDNYNLI